MNTPSTILVIVGITGDLAQRKLIPAISALKEKGILPEKFHLIGITRQSHVDGAVFGLIRDMCTIFPMDLTQASEYDRLVQEIQTIEKAFGMAAQHLFYLSVPPTASSTIIAMLGSSGIARMSGTKLLLEKPFGTDVSSAQTLIQHINKHFAPENVFRIDHYLAKDMVQEMLAQRSRASIDRIDIVASERIGIEGRAAFYEQTGALRDMVQSHLLQLAAVALIDTDVSKSLPERRQGALTQLNVVPSASVRGQYEGYKRETEGSHSTVETFVSLTLQSSDPRFISTEITITTGKNMDKKHTAVSIQYKDGTECVYTDQHAGAINAYERVLCNAMQADTELFVSDQEVLECWRIIAPVQTLWRQSADGVVGYLRGSAIVDIV